MLYMMIVCREVAMLAGARGATNTPTYNANSGVEIIFGAATKGYSVSK